MKTTRQAARSMQVGSRWRGLPLLGVLVLASLGFSRPVHAEDAPSVAMELREELGPEQRFRWFNERLVYSLEIFNARVARAAIQVGPRMVDPEHGEVIPIQAAANSHGVLDAVYAIRNASITYIDPVTGLPRWSEKILDERGQRREYQVTYVQEEFRARTRRVRDGQESWFRRLVPSDLHDAVSWVFDVRSRDLRTGDRYYYYIYDGWKLSRLVAHVVRHESFVGAGRTWDSARVSIRREVLDSHPYLPWSEAVATLPPVYTFAEDPYEIGVGWISLDEARLPLGLEIAVGSVGRLRLTLEEAHPPR